VRDPDRSGWTAFCGKYETDPDDDCIAEVCLKDGDLWATIVSDMGAAYAWKLYPLGENTFGFKEDETEITFVENGFTCDGELHKKL
ncbi:MAG: hypothetical protein IJA71_02815, partial [Clostridia bacterium]|nr:hypothetical protein [Clostridia bacterium]